MTTRKELVWVVVLLCGVMLSAIGVVYAKHTSRQLFVEHEVLRKKLDHFEVNWGRLQLEQSTWAAHSRIERVARKRLNMRMVDAGEVIVINLQPNRSARVENGWSELAARVQVLMTKVADKGKAIVNGFI